MTDGRPDNWPESLPWLPVEIPEHTRALLRRHMPTSDDPAEQAFIELRGGPRSYVETFADLARRAGPRRLVTLVCEVDKASAAAVFATTLGELLVTAGVRDRYDDPDWPRKRRSQRDMGMRVSWAPHVLLIDDPLLEEAPDDVDLWMPCPRCHRNPYIRLGKLRALILDARRTRRRRVPLS